ncbi:C1 family peptidase [Treponema sp. OMZ 840]|uniref:aminopeptidase C n=1 Tax=Treponema sp. OMZ 840 TaxID=244313 RepID=UPI003D945A94
MSTEQKKKNEKPARVPATVPAELSPSLTAAMLTQFEQDFSCKSAYASAMNAAVKNGIGASCIDYEETRFCQNNFSVSLDAGEVTNQKQSGRCWMFAALNTMRQRVMKKFKLKNMELSQSYPLFWDKLEKSNWFLENILSTLDEPLEGRIMHHLLADPVADGGQWDMFADLVQKYGVIPQEAMPESFDSSATKDLTKYITLKLREGAMRLRGEHAQGKSAAELRLLKNGMMNEIYRILCISLGKPPAAFTWETRDKDDKFIRITSTPQEFFKKYVGMKLDDYVSLINAPTKDKPFYKTYTVRFLGNIAGGKPVRYLNLPIDELKKAACAQLSAGESVWFGSDVQQWFLKTEGLLSIKAVRPDLLFDTVFPLTKEQRLDYRESLMTHAMTFTGVNIADDGKPNRWRVENSWGKDVGKEGYWVMSDEWFSEFTYQVVINKKYLTKKQRDMLEQKPIELAPWDPMGSLAI